MEPEFVSRKLPILAVSLVSLPLGFAIVLQESDLLIMVIGFISLVAIISFAVMIKISNVLGGYADAFQKIEKHHHSENRFIQSKKPSPKERARRLREIKKLVKELKSI